MKFATAFSTASDTAAACQACLDQLASQGCNSPKWLLVTHTERHDSSIISDLFYAVAANALHGATTCRGVMSAAGYHTNAGIALGVVALEDSDGAYGTALATLDEEPERAARRALLQAIDAAGRPGELPALVWISASPGCEERLIKGIEDEIGAHVPIVGGSSADNEVAGRWYQFAGNNGDTHAVVVSVLYPSGSWSHAFQSGYDPTGICGTVTHVEGRRLYQIDHRPAAEVYDEWTQGEVRSRRENGEPTLSASSLYPFGRVAGHTSDIPFYQLIHPGNEADDQSIDLFADLHAGDTIELMTGSRENFAHRAKKVAQAAVAASESFSATLAGAVVIYCAGCMAPVEANMDRVAEEIDKVLGGRPFLGMFTFGEQGRLNDTNGHGNLMISMVAFNASAED